MHMSFEDQVRERAYHIWLSGGMADGLAHEHWTMAERAVKAAEPVVILTKTKPAAKAKVAAKPAAAKAAKSVAKPATKKAAKAEMATAH